MLIGLKFKLNIKQKFEYSILNLKRINYHVKSYYMFKLSNFDWLNVTDNLINSNEKMKILF